MLSTIPLSLFFGVRALGVLPCCAHQLPQLRFRASLGDWAALLAHRARYRSFWAGFEVDVAYCIAPTHSAYRPFVI